MLTSAPCALASERIVVDVADGVAVVARDLALSAPAPRGGCAIEVSAVALAREEGRPPPEVAAWSIDEGARVGGGDLPVAFELAEGRRRVRIDVVLRAERLVIAPSSLGVDRPVTVSLRPHAGRPPFGATAAEVHWVDRGVPAVGEVDLARDRESSGFSRVMRGARVGSVVLDVGAPDRGGGVDAGGASTAAILLGDLPLAIADAADDPTAEAKLGELAAVAVRAARSRDPLLRVVGLRTMGLVESGMLHCGPPEPMRAPITNGVATPDHAGLAAAGACPAYAAMIAASHPSLDLQKLGRDALDRAAGATDSMERAVTLPADEVRQPSRPPARRRLRKPLLVALVGAALVGLAALLRRGG